MVINVVTDGQFYCIPPVDSFSPGMLNIYDSTILWVQLIKYVNKFTDFLNLIPENMSTLMRKFLSPRLRSFYVSPAIIFVNSRNFRDKRVVRVRVCQ